MLRESSLESKIRRHAIQNGWLTYKFTSPGVRGVPDRIFIKNGRLIFVEFKSEDGQLSKLQNIQIQKLREHGMEVFVINNVPDGKAILC